MTKSTDPKQINKIAEETIEKLSTLNCFQEIRKMENKIYDYECPWDKTFYGRCQNELPKIAGIIQEAFNELSSLLEQYIAVRKVEMLINKKLIKVGNKTIQLSREPGDSLLSDFAKSEVIELVKSVSYLNGWIVRVTNLFQVCRSHIGNQGINGVKKG